MGVIPYWPLGGTAMTLRPEKFGLHITDYDFATSVEDFPQTETDTLGTFEVLRLWREMQREFSQHMEIMLRNRVVPPHRYFRFINGIIVISIMASGGKLYRTCQHCFPIMACYS